MLIEVLRSGLKWLRIAANSVLWY